MVKKEEKRVVELELIDELEDSGVSAVALVQDPAIEKFWVYMKKHKFVDPRSGEKKDDYIPRCMSVLVGDEGYAQDQAAAICYSTWDEKHSIDTASLPPYVDQTQKKKRKFNEYGCPEATTSIELNLKNRQEAIDVANYGPLNPADPNEEYWQAKGDRFNTTPEEAKSARCGNCAFFVQTKEMLACIAAGIGEDAPADPYDTVAAGDLGYCEAFDFKCAAQRTCDAWVTGGPITETKEEFKEPCWEGYEQYGTKEIDGKEVPNCIPVKNSKLAFALEKDQQIVVGPVAIPDIEIFRRDENGDPYFVKFSPETIARMQEKFMRELRNRDTNIEHNENENANSYIFESWIVEDPETDKANTVYKLQVPKGTWLCKMRIQDPEVWQGVKEGKFKGFSLEGNFIDKQDYENLQKEKSMIESIMSILEN